MKIQSSVVVAGLKVQTKYLSQFNIHLHYVPYTNSSY